MLILACVTAVLAALLHGYIFVLESLRWEQPSTRRTFGTTPETAAVTAPLAYNQGFYNLFLGLGTLVGVVLVPSSRDVGVALVVFGAGSMLAAALVLVTSDRSKTRAAVVQGLFPAITLLALAVRALS